MVGAVAAVVISAAWCALLPRIGPRLGFVDVADDDDLKVHSVSAVPLAGPGLLAGVIVGQALEGAIPTLTMIGLAMLTAVGVVDDRIRLRPSVRILIEVGSALLVAARWWELGPALTLGGAVVVVVAVNAVNLYDGIDGLAGGTGAVGLVVIALAAWFMEAPHLLPAMLAAALAGFLPFNRHPARVFLGDGGAYLVGAVTAVGLWDVGAGGGWAGVVAALGFLGMFVVDLLVTVLRRLRAGDPLFLGDRRHLYDLMVSAGSSVPRVTGRLVGIHFLLVVLTGAALVSLAPGWAALVVATIGAVALLMGLRVASPASP